MRLRTQPSYTPTAMDYDFALITLKSAASSAAGFLGMTVGTNYVTLNLTTAGYPVRCRSSASQWSLSLESACSLRRLMTREECG